MNKQECLKIIARIESTWGAVFDDVKKEIYGENLADLDYQTAFIAIKELAQTERFVPTIADIRKTYSELTTPKSNALTACGIISDAISVYGRYDCKSAIENIKSQDLIAHEIVKSIGYINICNSNLEFFKPQFIRFYDELSKAKQKNDIMSDKLKKQIMLFAGQIQQQYFAQIEGDCDE